MLLRLLPCLLLAFASARAQQASRPPDKPAHSLRLLCVESVAGADKLLILEKGPDGWLPRWRLAISPRFLTEPLGFRTRSLALAVDPSPPSADGAFNGPPRAVTGSLPVTPFHEFQLPAADTSTAVLVAEPAGDPKQRPYRVIVLETSQARFAAGHVLVQNLTKHPVAGLFGGKQARVGPGQSAIVQPAADQPADMAQITVSRQVDDAWQVVFDTRWPATAEYRRYLLLLPAADGTIAPFVMPEYPPFR
jgi:hypothetical protein